MASPLGILGLAASTGMTIAGGMAQAQGKQIEAQGAATSIMGSMIQTISKAFGLEVEAQQYDYGAMVASYQAQVDKINEQTALGNANYERDTADRKVEQAEMADRYQEGAAKAAQGASGIDVNSGSSVDARESMIELGAYDASTIRADGARKAYAFDVEAAQEESQAQLHTYTAGMNETQAANTRTAVGLTMEALPLQKSAIGLAYQSGQIGASASMLSAGASVASKWASIGTSAPSIF